MTSRSSSRRCVVFALTLSVLLSVIAAPRVHAQNQNVIDDWGGTIEVSTSRLDIEKGESLSYRIRLTKPLPTENGNQVRGWWVRVFVDGVVWTDGVYDADGDENNDIRWVPSVGWEFNPDDWGDNAEKSDWREVRVHGLSTLDRPVKFTHEVWDHNAYCPPNLHDIGVVTVNVIEDRPPEPLPTVSILDAARVTEGNDASFEVRLSNSSDKVVTVSYETQTGTAVEGTDFERASGMVRFDQNVTSQFVQVQTNGDALDEPDENFTVKLSNPREATLGNRSTGTGTITDDDDPPEVTIGDAPAVTEGISALFPVTLSVASGQLVTVAYTTKNGTATAGADYSTTSGTLEFQPGDTEETISVPTVDDTEQESEERFTVNLSNPSEATLNDAAGEGTIIDNDGGPTMSELSIGNASVVEGAPAQFEVTLTPASEQTVTVRYDTADGTARAGTDYTATTDTLMFTAGETSMTITVPTVDDTEQESEERFTVTLSNPSEATLNDDTGEGTIIDDDGGGGGGGTPGGGGGRSPLPTLSIEDAPVSEGDQAGFVVSLSETGNEPVTVAYATVDGTALAGADYAATSGTLRFEEGETKQTIVVPTIDDATAEETETFTVELSAPSGATVADGTATATITDDDEPPTLSIDDATAVSEGEVAEFTVRLSAPSSAAVAVSYATVDGTALAGADYAAASGVLRFEEGETKQTIVVPTIDDATAEETETFTVELSAPSGATVADGTATATITDDDEPPTLSIDDATAVSEGEAAEFTVRLSAPSSAAVAVSYATVDGTALAGSDYTAASGVLRFEPGETERTITVATLADEQVEGTEGFTVELRAPSGATIADSTGAGTISDNVARRIGLVNQVVLPEVGRALAFSAIKCRIDHVLAGSTPRGGSVVPTPRLSLSPEQRPGRWDAMGVRQPTLEQAFDDSLFLMQSQEDEDDEGRFAVWWCADYQNLGGGGGHGSVNWDGDVSGWHVGADAQIGPGLLAGVSVSRSRGSFDYQGADRSRDAAVGGYELGLASIHPYLAWSVLPDLDVWGTAGHAWGRLQIVDEQAGEFHTSPATLDSGMVGVSGRLLGRGATTLRLKGEWALAQLDVARAGTAFEAATMNMRRLRLSTEVSRERVFASGVSLTPWGELGLRHDGGDGETGAGLELGGGLRYLDREASLTVEGHGRWLTVHKGTLREWGFGALVRFAPGTAGRGPSVSLMPSWGETASGVQRLWERGATDPLLYDAPGARLEAQFGYGFTPFGGEGVLTPYGGVSFVREAARGYRLGGRLAVGRLATVSLEAERRERLAAAKVHTLMLLGTVQF